MGSVYLAADRRIDDRQVAVKVSLETDQRALYQFQAEAKALATLKHPGLPSITDYFIEPDGYQYLVMDYIDGDTMEDIVERRGPLPEAEVVAFAVEVLDIIEYMHTEGIIHRDLKPANVKRASNGKLFLVDFGIAKITAHYETATTGHWIKGMVSPGFAPWEQYTGSTDNRSDIYSFGAVLYYLLTGQTPPTAIERAAGPALLSPSQIQAGLTSNIDRLILKAMALRPADRFQSAVEMRQALLQTENVTSISKWFSFIRQQDLWQVRDRRTIRTLVFLVIIIVSTFIGLRFVQYHLSLSAPDFETELLLIATHRGWLLPALLISLLVGASMMIITLQRERVVNDTRCIPPTSTSSDSIVGPRKSSYKTARMAATDLRPVLDDWVEGDNRKVIEELILHEDFESLKAWIANASGERWLLMGYGRFGGTSLVKGAIQKATRELQAQGNGNVLVLYFDVDESDDQVQKFGVNATEIYFGTLTTIDRIDVSGGEYVEEELVGATKVPKTYHLSLAQSIDRSFLNWTPSIDRLLRKYRYEITDLMADLQSLVESDRSPGDLRKIATRLLGSSELPSRIVIIFDRIRHLETLEELSSSKLFSSEKMSVIAVARKEDVDSWTNSKKRLQSIKIQKWLIPCIWDTDIVFRAVSVLVQPFGNPTASAKRNFGILCSHLAYVGRGSLGRVLEELRPNEHPWYWKTDTTGEYFLQIDPLPHADELGHNAWKQELLQKNWATIIPGNLSRLHRHRDQARVGVYYLMDWIDERAFFTFDEVVAAADTMPVTISTDEDSRREVVTRLLSVLEAKAHDYLRLVDGRYVVQGVDPNKQEPRQIRYRRAKSSTTVEQQQMRFRRDNLRLDIIVEEVTDTSTPRIPQKEPQAERQIKILAVFAKPKGSDESRLGEEERTINECVTQCRQRDNLHLKSLPAARVRDLQVALMEDDYQVVHFSGYATETGELQFEDSNDEAKPVPKGALAELLRSCPSIECVILNAHHTLSQGQLIASGVSYTIAMDGPISHEASRVFVRGFYDAIGSGKGYVDAFGQGRVALGLDGFSSEEIVVPRLLNQSSGST